MSSTVNKEIVINVKRLKMRDYALLERKDNVSINEWIPLIARISNFTEDELLDLELDEFNVVQQRLQDAMGDIVKKANAGS
jgi:hypothetical protein